MWNEKEVTLSCHCNSVSFCPRSRVTVACIAVRFVLAPDCERPMMVMVLVFWRVTAEMPLPSTMHRVRRSGCLQIQILDIKVPVSRNPALSANMP